jgi:hypothetical protein
VGADAETVADAATTVERDDDTRSGDGARGHQRRIVRLYGTGRDNWS